MKSNAEIGFYGKLPMLGDFISRHLPQEFIAPWDQWLQNALLASHQQLGSSWLDSYLTSPIWRFVLSSGLCGDTAWAGILMPSVDKVGRYFPLTIAVPFEQSPYLPHLFTLGDNWFKQLESVALTGLEDDINMQSFEHLIQSIPIFLLPKSDNSLEQVADVFTGLNAYLLSLMEQSGYSLWTTSDNEEIHLKVQVYGKLPPIDTFSSFLEGNPVMQSNTVFVRSSSGSETNPPAREMASGKHWQSWAITDIGKRRKRNEDAILNNPRAGLWAVADGMGGHQDGDVASQLIVNTLRQIPPVLALETGIQNVQNCLQQINTQLRYLAKQKPGNHIIGSTVVILLADSHRYAFIWAGDSRLYRFQAEKLQQLTKDHCPESEYLTTDDYMVKQTNEISRAVGADDELELDCESSDFCDGDIFLLCSDGLDKEVSPKEIEQIMSENPPNEIADALLKLALQRGARDNISIVVVAITSVGD